MQELCLRSAEGLAKMTTVIVTVFKAAGLTVSEKKTETMLPRTPDQAPQTSPLVIEAAGQRYRQAAQFVSGRSCQRKRPHYARDKTTGPTRMGMLQTVQSSGSYTIWRLPCSLKVRMLKAEVMETLLYGCVTWTLGKEHFAELRKAHHRLLRIIDFQRRQLTNHLMLYATALNKAQCENVETAIRKRRLLFAVAVQWTNNERPTRGVMFGTMAGQENPGPGRPENNRAQCQVDDLKVFRAKGDQKRTGPNVK